MSSSGELSIKPPRVTVNGVMLLDKPRGITSHAALQQTKRLLLAKKAGHTGTLDPLATGLLPICFGEATKFAGFSLDADKTYELEAHFGVTTRTGDAEGEILENRDVQISLGQIEESLSHFRGEIRQVPSVFSAIHISGQRAYVLARQGQNLVMPERTVYIRELSILRWQLPLLQLKVRCSKGTYIRSLVEALGQHLHCGAHLANLRRTGTGAFSIASAVTLEQLENKHPSEREQYLRPIDSLLDALPRLVLTTGLAKRLRYGQTLALDETVGPIFGQVRVYEVEGGFLGLASLEPGPPAILQPLRLVSEASK